MGLELSKHFFYTAKPYTGLSLEYQHEFDMGRWVNHVDLKVGYDVGQAYIGSEYGAHVKGTSADSYQYLRDTQGALLMDVLLKTRLEKETYGLGAYAGANLGSKQWVFGLEGKLKFW